MTQWSNPSLGLTAEGLQMARPYADAHGPAGRARSTRPRLRGRLSRSPGRPDRRPGAQAPPTAEKGQRRSGPTPAQRGGSHRRTMDGQGRRLRRRWLENDACAAPTRGSNRRGRSRERRGRGGARHRASAPERVPQPGAPLCGRAEDRAGAAARLSIASLESRAEVGSGDRGLRANFVVPSSDEAWAAMVLSMPSPRRVL
jgi:hypothetical protein